MELTFQREINRTNRNLAVVNLLIALSAIGWIGMEWKSVYNFLRGPFTLSNGEVSAMGSLEEQLKVYVNPEFVKKGNYMKGPNYKMETMELFGVSK